MDQPSHPSLKFSPDKLSLLRAMMAEDDLETVQSDTIPRRPVDMPPPLSSTQERLWFLAQMEPEQATYNMPVGFRLHGRFQPQALATAIETLITRHEILRTTIATVDDQPVQVIHPPSAFHLTPTQPDLADTVMHPFVDLSHLPEAVREKESRHLITVVGQQPFNLVQGPLLRVVLLRLTEAEHILFLTLHHIIADGWSIGVFMRELSDLYAAQIHNHEVALPDLPLQFADYAAWERSSGVGERAGSEAYWRDRLHNSPTVLELPTDRPRPAVQRYHGQAQDVNLSVDLTHALRSLSQTEGTTLFMTLLAAFKVLLFRYSRQTDILVGTPVANRDRPETSGLIGPLFNTLVLRTDLSGQITFRQLLQRVRQVALDAYTHQAYPFADLVQALQPIRTLSHAPLFQVMFTLQNAATGTLQMPGVTITAVDPSTTTTKFDLNLSLIEDAYGLTGALEYNTDLFDPATITRMVAHWQQLLAAVVADPDQLLTAYPLLTSDEWQQLRSWNDTAVDFGVPSCLHDMFAAQVVQTPNAIAVLIPGADGAVDQSLTYRELDNRANQLAHYLQEVGVGPETAVGICVERSLEMVVGLFGILKAGGAYLPLDPDYPPDRLAFMIEDAQMPLLLTQQHLLANLQSVLKKTAVLVLDTDWPVVAQESTEALKTAVTPDNLAYIIYTSGSTGRPKGVTNSHRGIYNRLRWMQAAYNLVPADRVLQKTPFSFDVSVWEFFWPLMVGARLVLAQPAGHKDNEYLVQLIREQDITTLHFVPSMLQLFLETADVAECDSLQRVMCSGEALPYELAHRFAACLRAELHNLYGPTEAAVDVTYWPCAREYDHHVVPIGRPIANTQIHLLDAQGQPVPVGVPGELYIGGFNVARGYLHRAELTAVRFIPDPFSTQPGSRLYRTGDLARYLPDGAIEFLGRIDFQVKIRGFRIELGEIEACLGMHPAIREVVVLAREDTPGEKRLVAYMVAVTSSPPSHTVLRNFLGQHLPDYMIPAVFVWLEAMPLLTNGKVNRRELPAPSQERPELTTMFVPPRDSLELKLVQIWQTVLSMQEIGVADDFFVMGGHSLLAVRLMSHVQKAFDRKLPISTLFQHSTVEKLAAVLRQKSAGRAFSPLVPIQPTGSQPPLFFVHAAGGTALSYNDLARYLSPDYPVYGLEARGLDGQQPPHIRFPRMAADYVAAIRTIQPQGPYHLGGWCVGGTIAFEMARQLQEQGEVVALLALIDTYAPQGMPDANGEGEDVWEDATLYVMFMQGLADHFGKKLALDPGDWQGLARDDLLVRVLQRLQQEGILPPDAETSHIQHYLQVYLSNGRALDNYIPQPLQMPVVLFRATSEPVHEYFDETLNWNRWLTASPLIYDVPGDHTSIMFDPYVQILAQKLRTVLAQD